MKREYSETEKSHREASVSKPTRAGLLLVGLIPTAPIMEDLK